jgi:hypothetical protein
MHQLAFLSRTTSLNLPFEADILPNWRSKEEAAVSDVQEIYQSSIRRLPADARLRLAALILHDLADEKAAPSRRFALEILDELPGGQLFKTPEEADAYLRQERQSWDR